MRDTWRAAITDLGVAGRAMMRGKDTNDASATLAPFETASQR
jgi:hypothetical protein